MNRTAPDGESENGAATATGAAVPEREQVHERLRQALQDALDRRDNGGPPVGPRPDGLAERSR